MALKSARAQAVRFHARERRLSLAGVPELHRTHRIYGVTGMAVASIDTGAVFPNRTSPITFRTAIRITENTGEHRGLVFEFGDATTGAALWIGDETIGFHAGDDGTTDGATALFDNGAELPVGLELELIAAIRPGDGRVRLFASAVQGTIIADVPEISQGAPAGFDVIEALSVYQGQIPRHFISVST